MPSPIARHYPALRIAALALHVVGVAATLYLSLDSSGGSAAPGNDKLHHFAAYFAVSLCGFVAGGRRVDLAILIWMAGLGAGLEWAQGAFTDHRTPDLADLAANLLGVAAALAAARLARGVLKAP